MDVGLHYDELNIACEISITNTPVYEVKNIQKCFDAGFTFVFMISNNSEHLDEIRKRAIAHIDQSFHNSLFFVSKDEFTNQVDLILLQQTTPLEERVGGYRVNVKYGADISSEGKRKTLKDMVFTSMKHKE